MSELLAVAASLLWGTADYVGGSSTRRHGAVVVLLVSQLVTLPALVLYFLLGHGWQAPLAASGWAIAAGAGAVVGLAAFYRALADGQMGVVAPLSACGVAVPVVVGLLSGEKPSGVALFGIGCVVAGVVACAGPSLSGDRQQRLRWRPVGLALVSALAFGTDLVCLAHGSRDSVPATLLVLRLTSVLLLLVAATRTAQLTRIRRACTPSIVMLGGLDLGANACFALAGRSGDISVVAVLASLYPAVTMLLARQLDRERLDRVRRVGVLVALCGVVFIAAAQPGI